jgi:hypothetical protein
MFKNGTLGNIFWPEEESVTADWRKLHNEELHDLYSLLNFLHNISVIKSMSIGWKLRVASTGGKINTYRIVQRNPEGKRQDWKTYEDMGR